jgi:F0F1-type ATP synthase alpha subunit
VVVRVPRLAVPAERLVEVARVPEFEQKFLAFLESNAPVIVESILRARDLASQTEEELKTQLKKFEETHPDLYMH